MLIYVLTVTVFGVALGGALILALPSILSLFECERLPFCVHCGAQVVSRSHRDCWRCCRPWAVPSEEVSMGISGRIEPEWNADGPTTRDGSLTWTRTFE